MACYSSAALAGRGHVGDAYNCLAFDKNLSRCPQAGVRAAGKFAGKDGSKNAPRAPHHQQRPVTLLPTTTTVASRTMTTI